MSQTSTKAERRAALEAIQPWLTAPGRMRSAVFALDGSLDLAERWDCGVTRRARYDAPLVGAARALRGSLHNWPGQTLGHVSYLRIPRTSTGCHFVRKALAGLYQSATVSTMAKKKAAKAPEETSPKTGLAEHPVLVGFTAKEHARIVRAAGKTELSARAFIHQAAITAVAEVL